MKSAILQELNKAENYRDYGYDEKALVGRNGFSAESMKDLVNKVNKVE